MKSEAIAPNSSAASTRAGDGEQPDLPREHEEHAADGERGVERVEAPQAVVDRDAVGAEREPGEHADRRADEREDRRDPRADGDARR